MNEKYKNNTPLETSISINKIRMPRCHEFGNHFKEILKNATPQKELDSFFIICSKCGVKIKSERNVVMEKDQCYTCELDYLTNETVDQSLNKILNSFISFKASQSEVKEPIKGTTLNTEEVCEPNTFTPIDAYEKSQKNDEMHSHHRPRISDEDVTNTINNNDYNSVKQRNVCNVDNEEPKKKSDTPFHSGIELTQLYLKGKVLGSGKFGEVYKVTHKEYQTLAAAKEIKYNKKDTKEEILNEIEILEYLSGNEYILELYEVIDCCHKNPRKIILITEYLDGGDLFNQIAKEDLLTETEVIKIMIQILEGVLFMHQKGIIHRDLKPENIMYRTKNIEKIKIIDFGFAVRYDKNNPPKSMVGTTIFVAPEVLSYENQSFQTDIWSVGVIAYDLLAGITPFEIPSSGDLERQLTDVEIIENIQRCKYDFDDEGFIDVSDEAVSFISSILVRQPEKRPTADQCLAHSWLSTLKREKHLSRSISIQRMQNYVAVRKWEKLGVVIQSMFNFKCPLPASE